MFDPFELIFVQRGILEIAALSIAAGLIGTWIVLRGIAFYAHAVGTASFPGLVLAGGLGFSAHLGAGSTALGVAGSVGWLARRDRSRYDSVTALVLVGALALGVILASDVFHSGANIETLLFGSVLVISAADIWFAAGVSAIVLVASLVLEQRWLATGFDPDAARALGARSAIPDLLLLGLVALVAIAALSAVGALLATALLVVPAATTRLLCARLRAWQVATVGLVLLEGVAGLWLAVQLNAPPGATIAVLGAVVFALVALARRAGLTRRVALGAAAVLVVLGVAGCGSPGDDRVAATSAPGARKALEVVATTTQLGDIVRNVGGDGVEVAQILTPNSDPHEYEPRPRDVKHVADAELVFASGDGLDDWIDDLVSHSGGHPTVIDLASAAVVRLAGEPDDENDADPHWWHDPLNVERAIVVIRDALVRANPSARSAYQRAEARYRSELRRLDGGVRSCFADVPRSQRKLVTDHDAFGYFARRYGIDVIGAVIPSQTTAAQTSAGDVARLSELIDREGVKAVFPESSINPRLARALAKQSGISASYTLYGDTLGPAGSSGATYLEMEHANADQMLRGFTGGKRGCAIAGL